MLGSNQKLKFNPMELILYCKDLRVIRFCFDEAGPESAKKVSEIEFYFSLCDKVASTTRWLDVFESSKLVSGEEILLKYKKSFLQSEHMEANTGNICSSIFK